MVRQNGCIYPMWQRAISLMPLMLVACGSAPSSGVPAVRFGENSPSLVIEGLDECDDDGSSELHIDPAKPLVVVVHGCNASGGRFRALAHVFEAHGQQTVCYNYDDRDSLVDTSARLTEALQILKSQLGDQPVTVLGHSQGGLVARRALVATDGAPGVSSGTGPLRLVTVSSPFNGINASSHCSMLTLHILSLGISAGLCRAIAGDKWTEIHPDAAFMRTPGSLDGTVREHLEVVTDERNTCRVVDDMGKCTEDDFVFTVNEQRNQAVEQDRRVASVTVKAGHVEIVGSEDLPPLKLIELLQHNGVLAPTPDDKKDVVAALLRKLY